MKVIYDAVTGFPRRADDWNEIENRPEEFPPAAHTHVEADVTDLHRHDNKADLDLVGEHVSDKGTAVFRNMVDGGKMAFTNASGVTSCVSLTDGSDKRHIQMYSHDPKGTCTRVAINPSGAYYADSDGDDFDDGNKIARIKDLKNVKIELDDEQKAALKGDAGPAGPAGAAAGFGTPTAMATTLDAGKNATVKVTATGNDTGKVFSFEFGIPKGEKGEAGAAGTGGGSSSGAPAFLQLSAPKSTTGGVYLELKFKSVDFTKVTESSRTDVQVTDNSETTVSSKTDETFKGKIFGSDDGSFLAKTMSSSGITSNLQGQPVLVDISDYVKDKTACLISYQWSGENAAVLYGDVSGMVFWPAGTSVPAASRVHMLPEEKYNDAVPTARMSLQGTNGSAFDPLSYGKLIESAGYPTASNLDMDLMSLQSEQETQSMTIIQLRQQITNLTNVLKNKGTITDDDFKSLDA